MKGIKSNIVVIVLLLGLGFLGYEVLGKKKLKKKDIKTPEVHEEILSKTEIVNDNTDHNTLKQSDYILPEGSFSNPEELVFEIIKIILRNEDFKDPFDFYEKLKDGCQENIPSYDWFDEIPKNISEAEEVLKECSLFERYEAILSKKLKSRN